MGREELSGQQQALRQSELGRGNQQKIPMGIGCRWRQLGDNVLVCD